MTKARKLEVLQSLAEMERQSALARLAALRRQEAEALAMRQDLFQRRSQALIEGGTDPQLGAVASRFDGWVAQQDAAIQARLEALATKVAQQKAATARYFGRAEALRNLRDREAEAARIQAERRV